MGHVNASKLAELTALLECQDSIASHARQARDDDAYFNRTKARLEAVIARAQKDLDKLHDLRENADAIINATHDRKKQLRGMIKSEEHKIQIERFLRLQQELKELQEEVNE